MIFQNDFSAGWVPSDDRVNGRRNGLLAMDNCELDQNGALVLSGGTSKIGSAYPSNCHSLYSTYVGGAKHRYLNLASGAVYRDATNLGLSGSVSRGAFGKYGNYVLILSGNNRVKDTGSAISNLGLTPPATHPGVSPQTAASIEITGDLTTAVILNAEGTIVFASASQINIDMDATTFAGKIERTGANIDSSAFPGGGDGTNDDIFAYTFQCEDPAKLVSVRFEVLLETPASAGASVDNYFSYQWGNVYSNGKNPFNQGKNSWSILQCKRSDFDRAGQDAVANWSTVKGFRFSIQATVVISCAMTDAFFSGGSQAVLDGTYEYAQINVENNGAYVTRSVLSPSTGELSVPKTPVQITPSALTTTSNEAWIVRRGETLGGVWYVIKQLNATTGIVPFVDTLTDDDARQLNLTVNPFLKTVNFTDTPDDIFDVVGPIRGRMIYMTVNSLLVTEVNSPGTYDYRTIQKFSGNSGEKGLWLKKVGENTILVGTTNDVYILSGTWDQLPDGYLDTYLHSLGVSEPPLNFDACVYGGRVIFMARDGWRALSPGGDSKLLTAPNVDRLYRSQTCYGYSGTNILPFSSARYTCASNRDKLWVVNPTLDGARRLDVYDFTRSYWRPQYLAPSLLCSEEDGKLIGFFGDDSFLREIDVQGNKTLDGVTGQTIRLLFTVRPGENPRARNDSYTFKAKIFTNSQPVTVNVYKNEATSPIVIGSITTATLQEVFIDLSSTINVAQTWQVEFTAAALSDLTLTDWSIDYDARPNPVTYERIQPTNMGRIARKKFNRWPFVVDTRGLSLTLTPRIDGVSLAPQVVATIEKKTVFYEFPENIVGVDIGWTLQCSGLFERWQEGEPEFDWIRPIPVYHHELLPTNLGSAGSKSLNAWPFVFDCRGGSVTLTPKVDGATITSLVITGSEKKTYIYEFPPSTEGVDIEWDFTSGTLFEYFAEESGRMSPKVNWVRSMPSKTHVIGPVNIFRLGRFKAMEITVVPTAASITGTFVFDGYTAQAFDPVTVTVGKEMAYLVPLPKTTSGEILYVNLATASPMVLVKTRFLLQESGAQTDGKWITFNGS